MECIVQFFDDTFLAEDTTCYYYIVNFIVFIIVSQICKPHKNDLLLLFLTQYCLCYDEKYLSSNPTTSLLSLEMELYSVVSVRNTHRFVLSCRFKFDDKGAASVYLVVELS